MGDLLSKIPPQGNTLTSTGGRKVTLPEGITLLYAEAKMGDLLSKIPPIYVTSTDGSHVPKQLKSLPEGITHKQSHIAQKIAERDITEILYEFRRRNLAKIRLSLKSHEAGCSSLLPFTT